MDIDKFQKWCERYTEEMFPEFASMSRATQRAETVHLIIEELGESIKEMRKYDGRAHKVNEVGSLDNVAEELGDTAVLLMKLCSIYEIKLSDALELVKEKLKHRRQEKRNAERKVYTSSEDLRQGGKDFSD